MVGLAMGLDACSRSSVQRAVWWMQEVRERFMGDARRLRAVEGKLKRLAQYHEALAKDKGAAAADVDAAR
jgi:hypothetical protein